MINPTLLNKALYTIKFKPEVDMFASRLNRQFTQYCSFRPDPEASFIDAFTISWSELKLYCFPPFSSVLRVLQKFIQDNATGIVVVPMWHSSSTNVAYPVMVPNTDVPFSCSTSDTSSLPEFAKSTRIETPVKQTRVGTHITPLVFIPYPNDEQLCIIQHLKEYIKRTASIRGSTQQLLISHVKPHGPVGKDTISRWTKSVLASSGVDVSKFKSHSTRAASSSFLVDNNISIKDIMLSAGWSNERTFQQFYNKPTEQEFNYGGNFKFVCPKIDVYLL
jgi:hypothetical protein